MKSQFTLARVDHLGQLLDAVTVPLGVATFSDDGHSSEALIRAAEAALYRAKREGRDRVVASTPPHLDHEG